MSSVTWSATGNCGLPSDLVTVRLEGEVAGVEEAHVSVWDVTLERLGARWQKKRVVTRGRILQQSKTISVSNPDLARAHSRPSLSGEQALEIGLLSRLCVTPYGDQSISRIGGDPYSNPIAEHELDAAKGVRPRRHRQVILSLILWLANRQPSTRLAEG
jgi:hypothetical protein